MYRVQGAASVGLRNDSYFLTRVVFLRALAFVYGVAFLVAKHQNKALIGDNGITPARKVLDRAQELGETKKQQRDAWLNSTVAAGKAVLTDSKNPIVQWKNLEMARTIGVRIKRTPRYRYWRERLWDREEGLCRPVSTLIWLSKVRLTLNPWMDGIASW